MIKTAIDVNRRVSECDWDTEILPLLIDLIEYTSDVFNNSLDTKTIAKTLRYWVLNRYSSIYVGDLKKAFENGISGEYKSTKMCTQTFIEWLKEISKFRQTVISSGITAIDKIKKQEEIYQAPILSNGYNVYAIAYFLRSFHEPGRETISFEKRVESIKIGINPYNGKPLDWVNFKSKLDENSRNKLRVR